MEIGQLRAFLAVAEELHFGRAAERLHMAQPPLSRIIKQLERELGTTLFDRNTRRVELTASGKALVAPALEVLHATRRAAATVRSAAVGESGVVRIAFAGVSTYRLVAQLARAVRTDRPGIELELSSQQFAQPLLQRLLHDDTDLALGRWDVVPKGLGVEVVMEDSLTLAVPDTHPLARRDCVAVADLAQERFVPLSSIGSVVTERLRRLASDSGFVPHIAHTAPDTQTALALVSAEVGCHLTLASVAANASDPSLRFLPVSDDAPDVHLRMAWRLTDADPALHAVRRQLAAIHGASEGETEA